MPWTNDQAWALVNKPQPEEIRLVDLINKPDPEEIYHHGILGMKWGIRRYQNPDGSLTPAGKKRYLHEDGSLNKKGIKRAQFGTSREQRDSLAKELTRLDDEKSSKKIKTSEVMKKDTYSVDDLLKRSKEVKTDKDKEKLKEDINEAYVKLENLAYEADKRVDNKIEEECKKRYGKGYYDLWDEIEDTWDKTKNMSEEEYMKWFEKSPDKAIDDMDELREKLREEEYNKIGYDKKRRDALIGLYWDL